MFNLLRWIRPTKKEYDPLPIPKDDSSELLVIGNRFRLADSDPFPPYCIARIVDLKEGWVRYTLNTGWIVSDYRMPCEKFLSLYRPYDPKA